jgi:glycosyltransferase involved in cell wall biosynthesis
MNFVSIIIPTFNRKTLLRRALQSVYQQSYSSFEVIVVDDGSTDQTKEMIISDFPLVRYFYKSNQGVSAARNLGLDHAKGEWLAFLDSDDEWLPKKLENQINLLKSRSEYKICHTNEQWVRHGVKVNQMKKHKKTGGWIFPQCLPLCAMSPSSIMIQKSVFADIGHFDTRLSCCEDYDMWLRVTAKYPVLFIEEPQIIKYGGHDDQLSKKYWGMDRFRVQALQNILSNDDLNEENRQKAIAELLKKCRIIQQGAEKRGKVDDVQFYQKIIDQYTVL